MRTATLRVRRYDPQADAAPYWQEYRVPWEEGATVLAALLHLYEHEDSTLAFRYGCRYKHCGLCALEVDGRPRLACLGRLRDGMALAPLHNLPLLRDLAIDRALYFAGLRRWGLHLPLREPPQTPRAALVPDRHKELTRCVECLGCLATCPHYDHAEPSFGGPYLFVKLAQLHTHPDDRADRVAQALAAGIARCRDCGRCRCLIGLPLVRQAIDVLARAAERSPSGPAGE